MQVCRIVQGSIKRDLHAFRRFGIHRVPINCSKQKLRQPMIVELAIPGLTLRLTVSLLKPKCIVNHDISETVICTPAEATLNFLSVYFIHSRRLNTLVKPVLASFVLS